MLEWRGLPVVHSETSKSVATASTQHALVMVSTLFCQRKRQNESGRPVGMHMRREKAIKHMVKVRTRDKYVIRSGMAGNALDSCAMSTHGRDVCR
jgi:hypothetical protein